MGFRNGSVEEVVVLCWVDGEADGLVGLRYEAKSKAGGRVKRFEVWYSVLSGVVVE